MATSSVYEYESSESSESMDTTLDLEDGPTEQTALLGNESPKLKITDTEVLIPNAEGISEVHTKKSVVGILSLLLIAVFIGNVDSSIVLATNGTIASHFSQLEHAVWLISSFGLSSGASQPVLGKLSDVLGRKTVLLSCYAIFALGTVACGVSMSMWQIILARAITGIGAAGSGVIVAILITDLVPKVEIASWRSYVNVVATTGRSMGGPLGGWLADSIGWRWSFVGQGPLFALAFVLVLWKLPNTTIPNTTTSNRRSKLARIDFLGSFLIVLCILTFLLAVELPSRPEYNLRSPLVIGLFSSWIVLAILFIYYEFYYAREPVFPPLLLLRRNVWTSFSIMALQSAAQLSVMFSVPLYFQVTENASNTVAGAHLTYAVIGNASGGLLAGWYIKRTGRYKAVLLAAALSSTLSYALLVLRWDGEVGFWDSTIIFPGGFGMGLAAAATFVSLTSDMQHKDMAVATAGLYLSGSVGMVLGINLSSGLQKMVLRSELGRRLSGKEGRRILRKVLEDVGFVGKLKGVIREEVVGGYVRSLEASHWFSVGCAASAFLVALVVKEHSLEG